MWCSGHFAIRRRRVRSVLARRCTCRSPTLARDVWSRGNGPRAFQSPRAGRVISECHAMFDKAKSSPILRFDDKLFKKDDDIEKVRDNVSAVVLREDHLWLPRGGGAAGGRGGARGRGAAARTAHL